MCVRVCVWVCVWRHCGGEGRGQKLLCLQEVEWAWLRGLVGQWALGRGCPVAGGGPVGMGGGALDCRSAGSGFRMVVVVMVVVVGFGSAAVAAAAAVIPAAAVVRLGCLGNGRRIGGGLHFNLGEGLRVSGGMGGGRRRRRHGDGGGFGWALGRLLLNVGGERRSHGDRRLLLLLVLLFLLLLLLGVVLVVLGEADVPRQAADGRHRLELVHNAARDVVDVVVVQLDPGVPDALATQLVQFGVVHPLHTLHTRQYTPLIHTHTPPNAHTQTHTHTHTAQYTPLTHTHTHTHTHTAHDTIHTINTHTHTHTINTHPLHTLHTAQYTPLIHTHTHTHTLHN